MDKLRIENEKLQQQMKQLRLGQSSFTIIIPGDTAWVHGVHVVEHLSTAITLVLMIQCQKFCDFLKAEK